LFQVRNVHLASPTAIDRVKNESPERIAHALGVSMLLSGTLQAAGPSGDRIVAVLRLEDLAKKRLVWTQQFTGATRDLLRLEDDMYERLTAALNVTSSASGASAYPTENIDAYELYLRGRAIIREKRDEVNIRAAMDLFNKALQKDQRFGLAYAGLADSNMYMFDLKKEGLWADKAVHAAEQASRWSPERPEAHFVLGSAYRATGKINEAIAEFQRALRLAPNSDEAYRRLASAYTDGGRSAEAIENYKKAIEVNPYYWMNHNQLGAAYLKLGDYPRALECFRKVAEIASDLPTGYSNMAVIYFHEGQFEQAIPQFQKAIELKPTSMAYSNLAACYSNLGLYVEAVKTGEKAVALNPNDDTSLGNLADAYRWSGQPAKAAELYKKAIALAYQALQVNPRNSEAMARMALYYAKQGATGRALEYINKARAIDAKNVEFIFGQAVVESLSGDQTAALRDLRTAVEKGYSLRQIESEPDLKRLRETPRYRELISTAGVAQKR
jgi:tetratricopeptide (TPR) repeat protein